MSDSSKFPTNLFFSKKVSLTGGNSSGAEGHRIINNSKNMEGVHQRIKRGLMAMDSYFPLAVLEWNHLPSQAAFNLSLTNTDFTFKFF